MLPAWKISPTPGEHLVNGMLDDAFSTLSDKEFPLIHTDRGCQYLWSGWISLMNNAGRQQSMSRKVCSPDNLACEGFFGRLKNEIFYNRNWSGITIEQFIEILDKYFS